MGSYVEDESGGLFSKGNVAVVVLALVLNIISAGIGGRYH